RRPVINLQFTDTDTARDAGIAHGFVHTVQAANEGGFATTRRSDDRRGMFGGHIHADILKRLGLAEPGVQIFHLNANLGARFGVQLAPFSIPRLAAMRTALTETTISTIRTSAPAQAWRCHSSKGEMA